MLRKITLYFTRVVSSVVLRKTGPIEQETLEEKLQHIGPPSPKEQLTRYRMAEVDRVKKSHTTCRRSVSKLAVRVEDMLKNGLHGKLDKMHSLQILKILSKD